MVAVSPLWNLIPSLRVMVQVRPSEETSQLSAAPGIISTLAFPVIQVA